MHETALILDGELTGDLGISQVAAQDGAGVSTRGRARARAWAGAPRTPGLTGPAHVFLPEGSRVRFNEDVMERLSTSHKGLGCVSRDQRTKGLGSFRVPAPIAKAGGGRAGALRLRFGAAGRSPVNEGSGRRGVQRRAAPLPPGPTSGPRQCPQRRPKVQPELKLFLTPSGLPLGFGPEEPGSPWARLGCGGRARDDGSSERGGTPTTPGPAGHCPHLANLHVFGASRAVSGARHSDRQRSPAGARHTALAPQTPAGRVLPGQCPSPPLPPGPRCPC